MTDQTQIQWGIDRTTNPYGFGANINGAWSNLGTVTPAGVWTIPAGNIGAVSAPDVSFTQTGVGAITQTVATKLQQSINAADFGAVGDGVTDDTAALRAALATGKNVLLSKGIFKVTDMLTLGAGQFLMGANPVENGYGSTLSIPATFNLSALGVVRFGHPIGGGITNLCFDFYQNTALTTRADVIQYPPAIYATGSTRFILDLIRISRAWRGIQMTGNVGGAYIGRAELGALEKNIVIDGSLDFIHMGSIHVWPFGTAGTGMYNVWTDGETTAIDATRVDGLNIAQLACFTSKCVFSGVGTSIQVIPVLIGALQLDGDGSVVECSYKDVTINSLYSSKSAKTVPTISVTSGSVDIGNGHFLELGVGPVIQVTGGNVSLNGGVIDNRSSNVVACKVSGGTLEVRNTLLTLPATARTVGFIQQSQIVNSISTVARTSNVVTIRTATAHGYAVGQIVTVAATTTTGVNGSFVISAVPTTTTFTYTQAGVDVPEVADTGTVTATGALVVSNCNQVNGNGRMIVEVQYDDAQNFISGNGFNSGVISIPAGAYLGCYGPNRAASYTFTPYVEFGTNGDFAPTYSFRTGRMWYETNAVRFELRMTFTCNAYTTASGNLLIKGIPLDQFGGEDVTLSANVSLWSKIALGAGYSEIGVTKSITNDCLNLRQMGSGLTYGTIDVTNIPASTTNVEIVISGALTQYPKF